MPSDLGAIQSDGSHRSSRWMKLETTKKGAPKSRAEQKRVGSKVSFQPTQPAQPLDWMDWTLSSSGLVGVGWDRWFGNPSCEGVIRQGVLGVLDKRHLSILSQ